MQYIDIWSIGHEKMGIIKGEELRVLYIVGGFDALAVFVIIAILVGYWLIRRNEHFACIAREAALQDTIATGILNQGARSAKFSIVGSRNMYPIQGGVSRDSSGVMIFDVPTSNSSDAILEPFPLREGDQECCICLCAYEDNEKLSQICACHHQFHTTCLKKWCYISATCPLCNAQIL